VVRYNDELAWVGWVSVILEAGNLMVSAYEGHYCLLFLAVLMAGIPSLSVACSVLRYEAMQLQSGSTDAGGILVQQRSAQHMDACMSRKNLLDRRKDTS